MSKPLNFDQIRAMSWRDQTTAVQEHTDSLVVQAVLVAERDRMPVRPTIIQACEQRLADLGGLPADPVEPVSGAKVEEEVEEESPNAGEGEAGLSEGPPAESSSASGASEPAPAPKPTPITVAAPVIPRAIPVAERTKLIKTCRVFCLVPRVKTIRHGVTTLHLMPGKHLDGVPKVTAEYLASKRLVRIISEA